MKRKNKNLKSFLWIFVFFVFIQISFSNLVFASTIHSQDIIELTNQSRVEMGINKLVVSEKLTQAAKAKINDMFENQYFEHNSPQGLTPWDFIKSAGYKYRFAGENLAIDFISANGAHKALMASSSHRQNILNIKYTEIGVAVAEGKFEGGVSIIIVEEFGAPFSPRQIPVVAVYDLESELEELVNEVNVPKIEKESIPEVKSETTLVQKSSDEVTESLSDSDLDATYINKKKSDVKKIALNSTKKQGECIMENKISYLQNIVQKQEYNIMSYQEKIQQLNVLKNDSQLIERKNSILINEAFAREGDFQNQGRIELNQGLFQDELLFHMTFFDMIISFVIMGSAVLLEKIAQTV